MRGVVSAPGLFLGTYLGEFATSGIGQILAPAGVEFVFVDMEHSGFSFETVKSVVGQLHAAGIGSLVRPPSREYHHIARALDVGAQGLIPPMMTGPEAQKVANFMKYPPLGGRGVALGIAHDVYQPGPPVEKLEQANKDTVFVALIETVAGLADVEEIAAMDAVDALFIGHFDLTCTMGIHAQFDHPEFKAAMDRVVSAAKANNKKAGRIAMTPEEAKSLHDLGFDLVLYGGDIWVFQAAMTNGIAKIRELTGS
jgi:2-dehydro-3-deoxyglucarate aldolase/4-hydroxy-2-oxoheptanedioate aldolase